MNNLKLLRTFIGFGIVLSLKAGDEFHLMHAESIGSLRIGLSRKQTIELLGTASKEGRIEEWGADGQFHQQLNFKPTGITISLVSKTKSSPQTIESITAVPPCTFTTKRGIRIGSSANDVLKAYKHEYNKDDSTPGSFLVAGSIYGGLCFKLKNAKVVQIFLGAASE